MTRMTPLLERNERFARGYTPVALGMPTTQLMSSPAWITGSTRPSSSACSSATLRSSATRAGGSPRL